MNLQEDGTSRLASKDREIIEVKITREMIAQSLQLHEGNLEVSSLKVKHNEDPY